MYMNDSVQAIVLTLDKNENEDHTGYKVAVPVIV